jgi:hypothetical protein
MLDNSLVMSVYAARFLISSRIEIISATSLSPKTPARPEGFISVNGDSQSNAGSTTPLAAKWSMIMFREIVLSRREAAAGGEAVERLSCRVTI